MIMGHEGMGPSSSWTVTEWMNWCSYSQSHSPHTCNDVYSVKLKVIYRELSSNCLIATQTSSIPDSTKFWLYNPTTTLLFPLIIHRHPVDNSGSGREEGLPFRSEHNNEEHERMKKKLTDQSNIWTAWGSNTYHIFPSQNAIKRNVRTRNVPQNTPPIRKIHLAGLIWLP